MDGLCPPSISLMGSLSRDYLPRNQNTLKISKLTFTKHQNMAIFGYLYEDSDAVGLDDENRDFPRIDIGKPPDKNDK